MRNIPEKLAPLMNSIVAQLQGKLPETMVQQIANLVIQESQYQQIRETSYQPSYQTLDEIRHQLEPLQAWCKEEKVFWENIQNLLNDQNQESKCSAKERYSTVLKEFVQLQTELKQVQKFCESIQESCKDDTLLHTLLTQQQQKTQENLSSIIPHFPKLPQEIAKILQDVGKLSQDVNKLSTDITKFTQNLREHIEHNERTLSQVNAIPKLIEPIQQQIQQIIPNVSKNVEQVQQQISQQTKALQHLLTQQDLQQTLEKFAVRFNQDFSNIQAQIKSITGSWIGQLENTLQSKYSIEKIQASLIQSVQNILEHSFSKWDRVFMDIRNVQPNHDSKTSQLLQDIWQSLHTSRIQDIKPSLEQFQDILNNIKRTSQQLASLPQQLELPQNFATTIESIPDHIKKVRDYLEHFRHDVSLVAQHDLELLKATREQATEYTKLQTSILPEMQALQQSWQKLSTQLNNYWSANQETFSKNMSELASATTRIKVVLEDILRYQQEGDKHPKVTLPSVISDSQIAERRSTFASSSDKESLENFSQEVRQEVRVELQKQFVNIAQELQQNIRKEFANLMQQARQDITMSVIQEVRKELAGVAQEIRQEIRKEISSTSQDSKQEWNKSLGQKSDMLSSEIHTLEKRMYDRMQLVEQSLQSKLQNIDQTVETRIVGIKQYLDKLDESILRIEQRNITREMSGNTMRELGSSPSNLLHELTSGGSASSEKRSFSKELAKTSSIDTRISTKCPFCDKKVAAPPSYQGKEVQCKECGKKFLFPEIK